MFDLKGIANWQIPLGIVSSFFDNHFTLDPQATCSQLNSNKIIGLSALDATIFNAVYHGNATQVPKLGASDGLAQIDSALCQIQFYVNTSSSSAITAEIWLPTDWNNRFLALGNGGLGGLIDYDNLNYGTALGFATVASNNGHDGNSGLFFANNSEVLADFTSRAIHVETLVGKRILKDYYNRYAKRSYYMGCSTGGRQGIYAALNYPDDFDGVLAGAPATNFINLLGWSAIVSKAVGAPDGEKSENFIPSSLSGYISSEIKRQCHLTVRSKGGFISEPEACAFRPEELICDGKNSEQPCLSRPQVEALRVVYSPLYGLNGEFIFPRLDPGAEDSPKAWETLFSGKAFQYSDDWMKYVVYGDPNYDYRNIDLKAIAKAQAQDPGNVSTYTGDLSAFRDNGGKLITYHGLADSLIPSGNSRDYYGLVSRTMNAKPSTLDEFYRLFLVPGMDHCIGGRGAFRFGQHAHAAPPADSPTDSSDESTRDTAGDSVSNILLELVDWVENGKAPDIVRGASKDGKSRQVHCRYPKKVNGDDCIEGPQIP